MPVLIIDNYDSFTFNLYQMVQAITELPVEVYRNNLIDFNGILEKKPSHIILSPGPGHPKNPSDFQVCKDVILNQEQLGSKVLGVCLGHQGIVHHLGGQVIAAPDIVHGKTSEIHPTEESPLLEGLSRPFQAMRYHSLVAADENFPAELRVTSREKSHNLIMSLQHKSKPLYGVQFHPESIGTPEGSHLLRNFIERC